MSEQDSPSPAKKTSRRGFASLSPEQLRQIASRGGKEAHRLGRAHRFSYEEAKEAGKRGGTKSRRGSARKPQSEGKNGP
jgi:general stress protein YciG